MNAIKLLSLALACAAVFSGCNSDEEQDNITRQSIPSCINIFDTGTDQPTVIDGVSYSLDLNYTTSTAVLHIYNLKTPDGVTYPELVLSNLPWAMQNTVWKSIHAYGVMPTSPSGSTSLPVFNSLTFSVYDRLIDERTYFPCFKINYSFGQYSVVSTTSGMLCKGETTLTINEGANTETSTSDEPYYLMQYNAEKGTMTVNTYIVHLMPTSDVNIVQIQDIPCTVTQSGRYYFELNTPTNAYTTVVSDSNTGSITLNKNGNLVINSIKGVCTVDNLLNLTIEYECPQNTLATTGLLKATATAF